MPRLRPFTPIFDVDLKYGDQATPGVVVGSLNGTASPGAINVVVTLPPVTATGTSFDPATSMTGLEIWLAGDNVGTSGSTITQMHNAGTLGGDFVPNLGSASAVVGTAINGHATISVPGGSHYICPVEVGRWLTDDVYDIYAVIKAAAQINKALVSQHDGTATIGRCVWGTADDGVGAKARMFFNNGTNRSGVSTPTPFDDTPHLIRWHSDGAGDHYIQVDGGTDELVITGQTFTPMNTTFRLFCIGGTNNDFTGTLAEMFGCDTVQSVGVAADANAYLMDKYGI
jgi:hypothetical protein